MRLSAASRLSLTADVGRKREILKYLTTILAILAGVPEACCANPSDTNVPALKFFVVSETAIADGRFIDTVNFPKLGYISQPALVVTNLQSVENDTAHSISYFEGKRSDKFSPALLITMHPVDATRFSEVAGQHIGSRILLMLGDMPLIAPRVRSPIASPSVQLVLDQNRIERIGNILTKFVQQDNHAQQWGPGYPPQGVGSPDP